MKVIDPHIHLFDLNNGDYHWLKDDNEPLWPDKKIIQRNFTEQNLSLELPLTLAGFVHIEAGFDNKQPWRELTWLEQHCNKPFKSIAFADVTKPLSEFLADIKKLENCSSFVGIRYIFNNQIQPAIILKNIKENLNILADKKLIFEVQLPAQQAAFDQVLVLLLNKPELTLIINHAAFPPTIDERSNYTPWLNNIEKLAQLKNVYIKCSGWEMVNRQYQPAHILTIIKVCIRSFGEHNVMLASNFPLTLFSKSYQRYWLQLFNLLKTNNDFSSQQVEKLFYSNALHIYQLAVQ